MTNSTEQTGPAGTIPAGPAARTGIARPAALIGAGWLVFRSWRRSRPFWAGILLIIAGAELLLIPLPLHSMGLILHIGVGGVSGILIGAVLIVAGLLLWFNPAQRMFYSIVAVLLAIAALVASNLGGFLVGTALGVIGGSLGFAWTPLPPGTAPRRLWGRRPRVPAEAAGGLAAVLGDATDAAGLAARTEQDAVTDADMLPEAGPAAEPGAPTHQDTAAGPGTPMYHDTTDDLPVYPAPARVLDGAVEPTTGRHHGTVIQAFGLLPILAILAGLLHLGSASSTQSADPSATATPAATCTSTSAASPAPASSPSTCSAASTASQAPDPTTTPDPSPGASTSPGASPSTGASASPSASPSPAPTGTVPTFAIAASQSTLTASSATITGFAYDGVVSVPTASGSVQMMEFTATSLDLSGMQLAVSQGGGTMTTTATTLDLTGNVVLYATELSGDLVLAGIPVPVTITPSSPTSVLLQFLSDIGVSQAITLQMTNVTTLQPFTSANAMSTSDLQIS
jgi:hypothetical protein